MDKKIVLDCLGGDHGIKAMLAGAVAALRKHPDLKMVLVGDAQIINPQIAPFATRVEVIDTQENIAMDEHPTQAIRSKPNSSLVLGLEQLKKREDCGVFVSAGSTGAVLTGGFMKVGRIPGVSRPALCPSLPTFVDGQMFMLVDCGANMDCTPINLVHFAVMANEYRQATGLATPRIGLLNVGAEATKGNTAVIQAHQLLTKLHTAGLINFVGNVEADQVFKGVADVVVADGFWGNVLLKGTEGTVKFVLKSMKQIMTSSFSGKIAGLLLKKKITKFKQEKMDNLLATIFLGLQKPVVKMHGNAECDNVVVALEYAMTVADLDLNARISAALTKVEPLLTPETPEKA